MKSIQERLKENYILGCIKYKNGYQFYLMAIAWWIIDYATYDPSILLEDRYNFRNGIYTVTDDKIKEYLDSISEDEISLMEVKNILENFKEENHEITFLIDFDNKEYISGFGDIDVEEYLPDLTWIGKFDLDPINYLPANILN